MKYFILTIAWMTALAANSFAENAQALITANRFRIDGVGAVYAGDTVINGMINEDIHDGVLSAIPTFVLGDCATFVKTGGRGPNRYTRGIEYQAILDKSLRTINNCNTNALILSYLAEVGKSKARNDPAAAQSARRQAVKSILNAFVNASSPDALNDRLDPALKSAIQGLPN